MIELMLNHERRYLEGPDFKFEWLKGLGFRELVPAPTVWPHPDHAMAYVCVVTNPTFEAALWVQDYTDWCRCKLCTERPTAWFEIETRRLEAAPREPAFGQG